MRWCIHCQNRLEADERHRYDHNGKRSCHRCLEAMDDVIDDLYEEEMDRRIDMEKKEG